MDLDLPPGARFVAGYAHEGQSLHDQEQVRTIIEVMVGEHVDVAASCGLGRRDIEAAPPISGRAGSWPARAS